ncbi:MAG: sigma 54-interacting transcriptional regulator [Planctomycetaceae bacterium]
MKSTPKKRNDGQRIAVTVTAMAAISYSLIVIWYVATFPDIGVRCLLPTDPFADELPITQFIHSDTDCLSEPVRANQRLLTVGGKPSGNFLLFVHNLARLRSAVIPPGGQLAAGADPSEQERPPLVEIASPVEVIDGTPRRMVELILKRPLEKDPDQRPIRTYVAIKPMNPSSFLLTIFWFLCQLMILGVALTAFWQRPTDRVVRLFCLMCCASMAAFVGGFHWWVLAASPLLNLPFIFSACLLPAVTLHFFSSFPRESFLMQSRRNLIVWLVYAPPIVSAVVVAFTYWTAYALNGASTDPEQLSLFQKLVSVGSGLAHDGALFFDSAAVCARLLYVLRVVVYSAIMLSCIYFSMTVVSLATSLLRAQNPVERRQASGILIAALVATVPILYTLFLAFFRRSEFALGQAQLPMFVASGLFMAAYAHGMLKHRLILANEILMRSRHYMLISIMVTGICALLLAGGVAATRVYSLPKDSSIPLKLSLFLILVVAIAFVLWARDRIQTIVDLRFFSEKYQLDKTLKQLNQASGYLTDPAALAEITLSTCGDVMDASTAAMFVREGSGTLRLIGADKTSKAPDTLPADVLHEAKTSEMVVRRSALRSAVSESAVQKLLQNLSAELVCFLRGDQGVDGLIVLGKRTNGVAYSPEDVAFLQAIGQMTVLALHSSRANQNLAQLNSELKVKVDRIAEQQRQLSLLRAELTSLQEAAGEGHVDSPETGLDRGEIRGKSPAILSVLETVRKAAASTATILIRGESGTGKELLARVVHRNSDRADKPLVGVNCAALAPSLLESELFGHVRGAFTGASSDKEGRFQAASGGTLFLDEIGDISLEIQVKLLRVLQERCFEPVGSNRTLQADVRLIAATNRDLEAMISKGEFREDLYYRLNVVSITLPPLRERREDLIELVFFFLNRAVRKTDKRIRQIDPEALAVIEQHRWPGNIRELENVIERAVVLADGDTITLKDLPTELCRAVTPVIADSSDSPVQNWETYDDLKTPPSVRDGSAGTGSTKNGLIEKQQMLAALKSANGNKARAARNLKMPRSTFYSKLKKHGLAD